MKKSIEIIIDQNGHASIDARGFVGTDCEEATAFLEETLGKIHQKRRKTEYYRRGRTRTIQRLGQ